MKVTYLLLWIGDTGRDIFNTWTIPEDEAKCLNVLYEQYARHVQPKLNPVFARFKFNNKVQGSNTVDQFITKLKLLSIDRHFNDADDMIRDNIVFGINVKQIQERLINEGEMLTLDKAIQICQNFE